MKLIVAFVAGGFAALYLREKLPHVYYWLQWHLVYKPRKEKP
jgi:hypothetical protein